MTQIRPNLFVGNFPDDGRNPSALIANKITAVLQVSETEPFKIGQNDGIRYDVVPMGDGPGNPPWMIPEAVKRLGALLDDGHTVLIHCWAGFSRAPHITSLYLANKEGKDYWTVWNEIRSLRPGVHVKSFMLR